MEKSTELRDLAHRLFEAMNTEDITMIENLFSQKEEVLTIGSDPNEWWDNYKKIISALKAQMKEMSGARFIPEDTSAYSEGSVGWFASRVTLKLPDNLEIPFRVTGVFHQENGSWKLIQWHASIGIPNEEAVGQKLTT